MKSWLLHTVISEGEWIDLSNKQTIYDAFGKAICPVCKERTITYNMYTTECIIKGIRHTDYLCSSCNSTIRIIDKEPSNASANWEDCISLQYMEQL